ncbi:ovalbumin-related protein X-like [Phyllopteryx taeniolatus]|uniref:ovalbumin-related protein X-like n=1 Tax=Phyllopteryx taeniolatus TaxID=161469 RepID=UPI002AD5978F|nr:ovalbumin-related protein X-like [Phyllopteryx taeniolatus]
MNISIFFVSERRTDRQTRRRRRRRRRRRSSSSSSSLSKLPSTMSSAPLTALAVLCLALPPGCRPAAGDDDDALRDPIRRNTDFSTRLYRALASRTDDNVLLAAASVRRGLAALLAASGGTTREQLRLALGPAGPEPQDVPDPFSVTTSVPHGGAALNLKEGVAVFADAGAQPSASYADLVQSEFGGAVKSVSFAASQDAADTVNAWVRRRTGDEVQDLVAELEPDTRLLLATAASYQGRFSQAFNASATQDERFYVDKYHTVSVPMMFRADKYFLAYDRSLKAGVLRLPMADGAAMLVVLPDEDVDLGAVEDHVTSEKIRDWIGRLKKTKLEVQLPRFLLDRSYSLADVLRTLGVVRAFGEDADLSDAGVPPGVAVSQVLHKAVASMDESGGGDASGGGAAAAVFSDPPPRLTVNRPFLFVVYHRASGALLLMGRLRDPTKK